jgi:elongation factor P
MLSITDLKLGRVILWNNEPYIIVESQHARTAQRRAFVRTKLRNVINGSVIEKTFNASDKVEEADLSRKNANFLYSDDSNFHFMDEESYEEISFSEKQMGDAGKFLKEGTKVTVLYFNNEPVTCEIPKKVMLKITETDPAVRGDTIQGNVMKEAKLETGATVQVPIFVQQGEEIVVNTDTSEYVERAGK